MTKQDGKAILFMTCSILQIFVQQTVGEIGCLTRAGTCWPTISYLCSCRSVRIFPCVLWMWHDSDPNPKQREMKGAWPPMSRGEEREGETAMLEEEPGLRSRVSRAQRIWFVGPHPGPQVVTERPMCPHLMYYSLRPPKHRWSPIAKLETNVWWFS